MKLAVRGIRTEEVERLRQGAADANGQPALARRAEGVANPCRHCLGLIADGETKLVLAYRPFDRLQPYAESGPIFLHRAPCARYDADVLPAWFDFMDPALIRGYGSDGWIRYETGRVVRGRELADACREILQEPAVAWADIRSKYGCFQCRVERA